MTEQKEKDLEIPEVLSHNQVSSSRFKSLFNLSTIPFWIGVLILCSSIILYAKTHSGLSIILMVVGFATMILTTFFRKL